MTTYIVANWGPAAAALYCLLYYTYYSTAAAAAASQNTIYRLLLGLRSKKRFTLLVFFSWHNSYQSNSPKLELNASKLNILDLGNENRSVLKENRAAIYIENPMVMTNFE